MNDQDLTDAISSVVAHDNLHRAFGRAIAKSARTGWHFTADDVRADCTPETVAWMDGNGRNVIGSLFAHASATGLIHQIARTQPARTTRRGNRNGVWTARRDTRNAAA